MEPSYLVIEDARISREVPLTASISIFDSNIQFLGRSPNWRCFTDEIKLFCCYVDPNLGIDDYAVESFTHAFLLKDATGGIPMASSRIDVTLTSLYVTGPVTANIKMAGSQQCKMGAVNGAKIRVTGMFMNLWFCQRGGSTITVGGSVAKIAIEALEPDCILDMSRCRMHRCCFSVNLECLLGDFITDTGIANALRAINGIYRPTLTPRQKHVRDNLKIEFDIGSLKAADDEPNVDAHCQTCFAYTVDTKYSPCGHTFTCLMCTDKLRSTEYSNFTCPLCRAPITDVEPIVSTCSSEAAPSYLSDRTATTKRQRLC